VRALLCLAGALAACTLTPSSAFSSPLQSTGLWVTSAASPASLVAQASAAGVRTLFVKAADGAAADPQFTTQLVRDLRASGLAVCAWTFDYGSSPVVEARAAAAAVRSGAQCLVVDAEGQYDKRYAAAQLFVRTLRRLLGRRFPVGLAGQAETEQHPTFPYSVFLGPAGFQFDMPQIYWRDLGLAVHEAYARVLGANTIYGRPVLPVGQLYGSPSPAEVTEFALLARDYRLKGFSFFSIDAASPLLLQAIATRPGASRRLTGEPATIRPGADGDEVVWAQELLNGSGARLPVGGFFGARTANAIVHLQARHHLRRTGLLDAATWRVLLRARASEPSWARHAPDSAR
jgi:peptidoglycan hydrolase-like protein with peptidoglycan-binding domain